MKIIVLLQQLIKKHIILELLCILFCLTFAMSGCSPSSDTDSLLKQDANQNARDYLVNNSDWKECCVSFINYALGTEIIIVRPDGSGSVYRTDDICSIPAFYRGECSTISFCESLAPSQSYSEKICIIVDSIYKNNELLQVDIPVDSINIQSTEGEPIVASVCVDKKEIAEFIVNYTGEPNYLPSEYKELISFVKELYPNSSILR